MDDLDDIVLDGYNPFEDDDNPSGGKGKHKSQLDDPLDPLAVPSKNKNSKKRPIQQDLNDDPENIAPTKKARQKLKKLDHTVLCSAEGLPRLRNETPWLQFRGKGHEDEDLQKLMRYYRLWASKLYPRFNFTDFSTRVMKASSNKQCKLMLQQWREEFVFKNSPDGIGNNSQDRVTGELSGMTLEDDDRARQISNDKDDASSDDNDTSDDDDGPLIRLSPTKPTTNDDDDDDMDVRPLFMHAAPVNQPPISSTTTTMSVDDFFAD
ncbi:replication fork protection component Swi3-domain-containing protein [Chlamydoabsidia padenii]|nr:replication fork protection component Swi3-domain-containing protein [Chlamydoabsidia padenii]